MGTRRARQAYFLVGSVPLLSGLVLFRLADPILPFLTWRWTSLDQGLCRYPGCAVWMISASAHQLPYDIMLPLPLV
jgi:hypothetical protein